MRKRNKSVNCTNKPNYIVQIQNSLHLNEIELCLRGNLFIFGDILFGIDVRIFEDKLYRQLNISD